MSYRNPTTFNSSDTPSSSSSSSSLSSSSSPSSSSSSPTTTSSYRSPSRSPTTTIRRRRGAVVHKAIRTQRRSTMTVEAGQPASIVDVDDIIGDVIISPPPQWTRVFQPTSPLCSPLPPPTTTTTATATTPKAEPPIIIHSMSNPTQQPPNGTHPLHPPASYAQTAAHNAPPPSTQPHPDKNLLYTGPSPTRPTTAPDVENKVSVVPHDWAAHPTTQTSHHIELIQSDTDVETDDNEQANLSGSTKRKKAHKASKPHGAKRDEVKSFWRQFTDRIVHPRPGLIGGVMTFRASFN